jgi:NTE family protein
MSEKLGLALGGGAALGWSHIGAIQALEENDIKPDIVAGTSIGSLVGACYIADQFEALEAVARGMSRIGMMRFADVQIGKNGFLRGDPIEKELRQYLRDMKIEELSIPFSAVATDLVSGAEVSMTSGDLVSAIRCSISIPGVFTPVRRGHQLLIDGGLVNNVPISVCRTLGADKVIGINVVGDFEGQASAAGILQNEVDVVAESEATDQTSKTKVAFAALGNSVARYFKKEGREPSFLGMGLTSFALILRELGKGQERACPADLLIEPKVGHITLIEFDRADELIALGRAAVEEHLNEIKSLLT